MSRRELFSYCGGFLLLAGCASAGSKPFMPRSDYPPDPWVKGYADADDCLGGEALAAVKFDLPEYPRRAYASGWQGWTIVRLDVTAAGETENVRIERAVPAGRFSDSSRRAVQAWQFEPPKDGPLTDCRVLIRYRLGEVTLGG